MTANTKNAPARSGNSGEGFDRPTTHQEEGTTMSIIPDTSTGWKSQPPSWAVQQARQELYPHEDGIFNSEEILERAREIAGAADDLIKQTLAEVHDEMVASGEIVEQDGKVRPATGWQWFDPIEQGFLSPIFDTATEARGWLAELPESPIARGLVLREVAAKPEPPVVQWATDIKVVSRLAPSDPWEAEVVCTVAVIEDLVRVQVSSLYALYDDGWRSEFGPSIDVIRLSSLDADLTLHNADDAKRFAAAITEAGELMAAIKDGAK